MTHDDTVLRAFGADVQRLIDGKDLTRGRTYELFREVLLGEQPDLQQGALLAALVAKGETPEEIAGAWQAIVDFDTVPAAVASAGDAGGPLVENSGTGMDGFKTFNVSSAAAVIAAAGGPAWPGTARGPSPVRAAPSTSSRQSAWMWTATRRPSSEASRQPASAYSTA